MKEIQEVLVDPCSRQCYLQVLLSGKECLHQVLRNLGLRYLESFVGKILCMSLLLKLYQKTEKASKEMRFTAASPNDNAMDFHGFFEYSDFMLELCCWRSLGRNALAKPGAATTSLDARTCLETGFIPGTSSWANSVRIWRRNQGILIGNQSRV